MPAAKNWPITKAAAVLTALWLTAFLVALAVPLIALQRGYVEWPNASTSLTAVSDTFAPHIGLILVYYLSARVKRRSAAKASGTALAIAVITSVAWNVVVLSILTPVLFGGRAIEDANQIITTIGPRLSWLVGPALGFFFANQPQSKAD